MGQGSRPRQSTATHWRRALRVRVTPNPGHRSPRRGPGRPRRRARGPGRRRRGSVLCGCWSGWDARRRRRHRGPLGGRRRRRRSSGSGRRVLGHALRQDRVHGGRQVRSERDRRRHGILEMGHGDRDLLVALEGHDARQRLEGHGGEAVLVGAAVDVTTLDLLGRHVGGRAHERPGAREARLGAGLLGQSEVGQVGVVARPSRAVASRRTLPGFTSRWTRPRAWAASRALATWSRISTAVSGSSGPSRRRLARSVPST